MLMASMRTISMLMISMLMVSMMMMIPIAMSTSQHAFRPFWMRKWDASHRKVKKAQHTWPWTVLAERANGGCFWANRDLAVWCFVFVEAAVLWENKSFMGK